MPSFKRYLLLNSIFQVEPRRVPCFEILRPFILAWPFLLDSGIPLEEKGKSTRRVLSLIMKRK